MYVLTTDDETIRNKLNLCRCLVQRLAQKELDIFLNIFLKVKKPVFNPQYVDVYNSFVKELKYKTNFWQSIYCGFQNPSKNCSFYI